MKKETEFFVFIPLNSIDIFNQRNNFVSLSEHWIDYRIKRFLDYTLMSWVIILFLTGIGSRH